MKRWILFVLSVALLYYVALIYYSRSMLFLVCAILVLECFLQTYNLFLYRKLHIRIHTPLAIVDKDRVLPVELILSNHSVLPSGQIRIKLQVTYPMQKKKQYIKLYSVVPGRKMGQMKAEVHLKFDLKPRYIGRVELSVRRVSMMDLLGILPSLLHKRGMADRSAVMVLPEKQEILLELNQLMQQAKVNRETEIRVFGEKDPPEVSLIREYQPGDALRNIHWKLTAKQDVLMVREHISKQGSPILFFVDLREMSEQYFQAFYSFGLELLRQKCSYYLVYYEPGMEELMRTMITTEEDFYDYLLQTDITGWERHRHGKMRQGLSEFRQKETNTDRRGFLSRHQKKTKKREALLPDWEEAYREKYRQAPGTAKLVLRRDLACLCNDEILWKL